MKKFRLKADAEFYADNIDDAFKVLGEHFLELAEKDLEDVGEIFYKGSITIKPIYKRGSGITENKVTP